MTSQRLSIGLPSIPESLKCPCGKFHDNLNTAGGLQHLFHCKFDGQPIKAHNKVTTKYCQLANYYQVNAIYAPTNNIFRQVDPNTNMNIDALIPKGPLDYRKNICLDTAIIAPEVGATLANAKRNETTRLNFIQNHKCTKYGRFFDHPLLKDDNDLRIFGVSNCASYGSEAEGFIGTLAKRASNINNISTSIMEKFIKKSISYTIHSSVANSVVNNLNRISHRSVDPSVRYEFSNESIVNDTVYNNSNISHTHHNHNFFDCSRNPITDNPELIRGNRLETRYGRYVFTVNLPVEALD